MAVGSSLGIGATDWGCTYDNVTGLLWEVKINDPNHLRHMNYTYSWYNSNSAINGGFAGGLSMGACKTAGRCDTEKFVADVNAAGMCGHSDWRMPRVKELESLADLSIVNLGPVIESTYFPNTSVSGYWVSSTAAWYSTGMGAWLVDFAYGGTSSSHKYNRFAVRLVRGGP